MAIKPGMQQRAQLALLLRWEGLLNNKRLRDLFGVAIVRSSELIREFREQNPRCVKWDAVSRSFHATPEFYRRGQEGEHRGDEATDSLSRYLALVGLPHAMSDDADQSVVLSAFPDLSTPNSKIFAVLSEAARHQRAVQIMYRSMGEPTPHERVISPHSIVRAGRRWHARAFCSKNQQFRDYALGRISEVKLLNEAAEKTRGDDKAWMTEVPVRVMAHPKLSPAQEQVIRFEYFNGTAARVTTCRGALVNYFIQDIRAAIDPKTQLPPDFQLVIENIKEIKPWIFQK
ncbi:MAG TPA: WYL domain-containing protein [Halothiobacillus sp.]|nr:WYL domain-containing protein [Halothiobacillus sp.]